MTGKHSSAGPAAFDSPARILGWLEKVLDRASLGTVLFSAMVLIVALAAADVVTGPQISFSLFYLGPVGLVAWFTNPSLVAYGVAFACAVSGFIADRLAGAIYSSPFTPYWNASVRFGVLAVVAALASALRAHLSDARQLARTDSLTGVANSRAFLEAVEQEVYRAHRYGRPLTLVYVDIDGFKLVNDTLGHLSGDDLLRFVAEQIRANVRSSDVVGRLGGDEFAILLPEAGSDAARVVVDSVRRRLRELEGAPIRVTLSIGAVTCESPPASVDGLLGRADRLMYEAKERGKDHVVHQVL